MYSLGMAILIATLLAFLLMCLICYITRKERTDIVKKAKAMNAGDWYKEVVIQPKNPFIEPIIRYVKILDVKFDSSGEPWVHYCSEIAPTCSYYDKVSHFLSEYNLVEKAKLE